LVWNYYRVTKNLVWILQGDQKFGMNITVWSKSWYEYYRLIKKFVWILQGDQKVGMNIFFFCKFYFNISRSQFLNISYWHMWNEAIYNLILQSPSNT
jgi:hypothetical protein